MSDAPIRDAATVILVRRDGPEPRLLMGQRGAGAAFMPSKYVFPGGRVDAADADVPLARPLPTEDRAILDAAPPGATALAACAIREVWEETGLRLSVPGQAAAPGWDRFCDGGHAPAADGFRLVFRAITPPGRPRRFDARFFLCDADHIASDWDDFSAADDELSHLGWLPLAEARALDVPFITDIVLGEVAARLNDPAPRPIPFLDNSGPVSQLRAMGAANA